MAIASEIHSLEEINYRSRLRPFLLTPIVVVIFAAAFLAYFPIGDKLKDQIKKASAGACDFDYASLSVEFLLPKIVIDDVILPASCFGREGASVRLDYVNLGFRLISFSPFGIPFKLETQYNRQPLELYYVLGFGGQTIRMKDQRLNLSRLESLMGNFKLGGTVTVDVWLATDYAQKLTALDIKAQSTDFKIPAQSMMGFDFPPLAVRKFGLETDSSNFPELRLTKLVLGDPDSPVRMDLKGTIGIREPLNMSNLKLAGELAFSDQFKEQFPVGLLLNESYTVKDGFYQIALEGPLAMPQLRPR